jgi:hypothetical protein
MSAKNLDLLPFEAYILILRRSCLTTELVKQVEGKIAVV